MRAVFSFLLLAVCVMLTSCPPPDGDDYLGIAKLTIHNECDEASIISIQFMGPNDAGFTPNLLDSDVPPGELKEFELETPTFESGLDGDMWYVLCELSEPVNCVGGGSTRLYYLRLWKIHAPEEFDWFVDCSTGDCTSAPENVGRARYFQIIGRE